MSLIYQRNALLSNYKPYDSALNFHGTASARVSPSTTHHSDYKKLMNRYSPVHANMTFLRYSATKEPRTERLEAKKFRLPHLSHLNSKTAHSRLVLSQGVSMISTHIHEDDNSRNTDDMKMNVYLSYLQRNQRLIKNIQEEQQVLETIKPPDQKRKPRQSQPSSPELSSKPRLASIEERAMPTDDSSNKHTLKTSLRNLIIPQRFASVSDTKQKKQDLGNVFAMQQRITMEQQHAYESRYAEKIGSLKATISELMRSIHQLSVYLNNKKKLFYVIKKLSFANRHLKQLLMNESNDGLIEPLTEQNLTRGLRRKESSAYNGLSITIEKFDFTMQRDLQSLSESIQEFILQRRVDAYDLMEQQIVTESKAVQKIEAHMLQNAHQKKLLDLDTYVPVKYQDFSYKSLAMTQYNPHLGLESIEKRLGPAKTVTQGQRTVARSIEKLVNTLDVYQQSLNQKNMIKGDDS